MSIERSSVRGELARELQRFGTERGGQVACLVVLLDGQFEFVYPQELTEQQIGHLEQAIAETLADSSRPH